MTKGIVIQHDIAGAEEFNHQIFYTDFLARFGFRYSAMVGFTSGDTMLSLNLQRRIQDQPFDRDDERLLVRMQSRLTAAAEIIRALHVAKIDSMSEAFELAGTAVVFFDRLGRVTRLNQRAEMLLDGDIRLLDQELVALSQEETGLLRRHLQAVLSKEPFANPAVSTPVLFSRPGKGPLIIRAQRLNGVPAELFSHSAAVAIITDLSERTAPSRDLLRRLFSLTPQETTVACLLMQRLAALPTRTIPVAQYTPGAWQNEVDRRAQRRLVAHVATCARDAKLDVLDTFDAVERAVARDGVAPYYINWHMNDSGNALTAKLIAAHLQAVR